MKRKADQAILSVVDLCVRRGHARILENISWSVRPGEHWAILGANGSGKTSLLSALTAYLTPTGGRIEVLRKRYGRANWPELRKQIGLVSSAIRQMMPDSEPALETVISGKYAMIDYWGKITPTDRRRARQILRDIECVYLAERPWVFLSQGERQRLLIGRALMAKPRLLILDEPCAGLDPAAREHFLQFLQRLSSRPLAPTLIFVTHHVEEIIPAFSHVLILKKGKILAAGTKSSTLRSDLLSEAFSVSVRLHNSRGRYQMHVSPKVNVVL